MNHFYADIHCHPSLKPYGKSFDRSPAGQNNNNRRDENSIWFYDSANLFERALQLVAGIAKFTQADCTTLAYGNVRLVCASLYPLERGFLDNKLGTSAPADLVDNFITGVGRQRVNYIQSINNYFEDLNNEYQYYKQLDGALINTASGDFTYRLVSSYNELENYLSVPAGDNTIAVVITIEGMHALDPDMAGAPNETVFLDNVKALKQWQHAPFFVTFAHHFYNKLCGHARSLKGIVGSVTNQDLGLDTGITDLGYKVLAALLGRDNGKRIYIDIKHMSALSRKQYIDLLARAYPGEQIPLIASHAAANGLRSMDEPVADMKDTAFKLLQEDINLYDNEIIAIARSGGLIGFQLDERRVASKAVLQNIKHSLFLNKIRHYRSELLWNQVRHVLELLDKNELFAWDCMAIGSDFDGIINPLNGFLTAEYMGELQSYLERHTFNYMKENGKNLKSYNQLPADEIVNRIFSSNVQAFMQKWFV